MHCQQCGKQIPDDSRFCFHCGAPVGSPEKNNGMEHDAADEKRTGQNGAPDIIENENNTEPERYDENISSPGNEVLKENGDFAHEQMLSREDDSLSLQNNEQNGLQKEEPSPMLRSSFHHKQNRFKRLLPIFIPFQLFFVAATLAIYYYYEVSTNERVEKFIQDAEKAALDGNYEEAVNLLKRQRNCVPIPVFMIIYRRLKQPKSLINCLPVSG